MMSPPSQTPSTAFARMLCAFSSLCCEDRVSQTRKTLCPQPQNEEAFSRTTGSRAAIVVALQGTDWSPMTGMHLWLVSVALTSDS